MLRKADGTVIQFEAAETLWKSPLSGATSPVAAAALEVVHNAAPASALSLAPPVLELHQPAVQQCLLYDENVRRAAASCAEVDVLGGQRQRSWSFSRGSSALSSKARQLIEREEATRVQAFQAALLERTFHTYALVLEMMVANLVRAAKGSRRMRRSEVLKEYLHALEQHRALSHACTALALPPQAAPAAAPKSSGRGHWWSQSRRSETDSPSSASER